MTDNIELKNFTEKEYHQFFKGYRNDPLMDQNEYVYSKEQTERSFRYNLLRKDYVTLGIFLQGEPVGSIQLKDINQKQKSCEIGIILQNDSVKRKGYGTAAMILGIEKAQIEFGMLTITAETKSINLVMRHILEKLHFQCVEIDPKVYDDGSDRYCYCLNLSQS